MTTISPASRRRAMPAHDFFPATFQALSGLLASPLAFAAKARRLSRLRQPDQLPDHILKDIGWPAAEHDRT